MSKGWIASRFCLISLKTVTRGNRASPPPSVSSLCAIGSELGQPSPILVGRSSSWWWVVASSRVALSIANF